jgi:hypothetical protein
LASVTPAGGEIADAKHRYCGGPRVAWCGDPSAIRSGDYAREL